MNDKFPYGYDVDVYIEKAFERMKETFFWATKEMLRKEQTYAIEEVDGEYQYVSYYHWSDGKTERRVMNCDYEGFVHQFIDFNEWSVGNANPVKETFNVPSTRHCSGGWYLEIYRIQKHELGGYSAFVQAGDRSAGGSRTFFIPPAYLKLPWEEFLDKYLELVPPGPFYVSREDLENAEGLKAFLGYEE